MKPFQNRLGGEPVIQPGGGPSMQPTKFTGMGPALPQPPAPIQPSMPQNIPQPMGQPNATMPGSMGGGNQMGQPMMGGPSMELLQRLFPMLMQHQNQPNNNSMIQRKMNNNAR